MKKTIVAILVVVIFIMGAALFSLVWAAWFVLSFVAVWIWRFAGFLGAWRKFLATATLLVLFLLMWRAGGVPGHMNIGSAAESRLPWGISKLTAPPDDYLTANRPSVLDEVAQAKEEFRQAVFRLRAQGNSVERALSLKASSDKVITYSQSANLSIKEVLDAKRAVDESLQKRKLNSVADLRQTKDNLERFLKEAEIEMQKKRTAEQAQEFLTDFRLRALTKSIDDVNDHMLRLESALNQLQREAVNRDMRVDVLYTVQLDEQANQLIRQQKDSVSVTNLGLKRLDASELLLDQEAGSIEQAIFAVYGDDPKYAVKVTNPQQIPIQPGVKRVTLFKRTVVHAGLSDLPASLRLPTFRYFLLKWPPPSAVKLRATLDLSSTNGPDEFPFAFDLMTDKPIKEVRIPANAFFSASHTFNPPRREGDEDVLESDQLSPSYFSTQNYIWIELMPKSQVFRNSTVQSWKEYLFAENLTAALVVMSVGVLCAIVFP